MESSPPPSASPNEINQSALSATEFTYSGESIRDDDDAGNHITKVPAEVHKLLVRPTATSLPNRFCEKRYALHEVVMLEQEEEEGDEANENSIVRKATNANNSTSACRLKTIGD